MDMLFYWMKDQVKKMINFILETGKPKNGGLLHKKSLNTEI